MEAGGGDEGDAMIDNNMLLNTFGDNDNYNFGEDPKSFFSIGSNHQLLQRFLLYRVISSTEVKKGDKGGRSRLYDCLEGDG